MRESRQEVGRLRHRGSRGLRSGRRLRRSRKGHDADIARVLLRRLLAIIRRESARVERCRIWRREDDRRRRRFVAFSLKDREHGVGRGKRGRLHRGHAWSLRSLAADSGSKRRLAEVGERRFGRLELLREERERRAAATDFDGWGRHGALATTSAAGGSRRKEVKHAAGRVSRRDAVVAVEKVDAAEFPLCRRRRRKGRVVAEADLERVQFGASAGHARQGGSPPARRVSAAGAGAEDRRRESGSAERPGSGSESGREQLCWSVESEREGGHIDCRSRHKRGVSKKEPSGVLGGGDGPLAPRYPRASPPRQPARSELARDDCHTPIGRARDAIPGRARRHRACHRVLLEPPFCDLAGLQGMGDSPDESMSIPSASASLAVVVGGRLASRKSEEEGRRAGSPRGKELRSLRSTARNKSQVGPTAREVRFAGGQSLSRQERRK